jgi:hypothetical protein
LNNVSRTGETLFVCEDETYHRYQERPELRGPTEPTATMPRTCAHAPRCATIRSPADFPLPGAVNETKKQSGVAPAMAATPVR